ncbi:MAG: ferredoxin [Pyrobaculum sp.]|jgi:ferredoxin
MPIYVRVDRWLCTACGLCQGPVFTLEKDASAVRPEYRIDGSLEEGIVGEELLPNVQRAARACPSRGITWRHID